MKVKLLFIILLLHLNLPKAFSNLDMKQGKNFGFSVIGGAPELIGADVRWMTKYFEVSAGIGFLPINSILQSRISFSPVPVDLQTGDTFNLYPSATYGLSAISLNAKLFPFSGGFFVKVSYSTMAFGTAFSANLRNETTAASLGGVFTGNFNLNQPMVTPGLGFQFALSQTLFFEMNAGVSVFLPSNYTLTTGSSLASIMVLSPTAQANYTAATTSIQNQVNQAVTAYQNTVKLFPSLMMSLTLAF